MTVDPGQVDAAYGVVPPDVTQAVEAIYDHAESYESAREYDEINIWELGQASRLAATLRQADIEYDPNMASVVVDAVVNRMEITGLAAVSAAGDDDAEATAALNQLWDDNELGLYWPSWQRCSVRDGDGYLVEWPLQDEPATVGEVDEVLDADPQADDTPQRMNITYADPTCARMFYDVDNPRRKLFFAQLWQIPSPTGRRPALRLNLMYPDRIEKYVSLSGDGKSWEPYYDHYEPVADEAGAVADQAVWPAPNPYGMIPAFHLRTDVQYGKPEARNAWALQDAISKLIEMQMVSAHFQGWPQAYALQQADSFKAQSIQEDPLADDSSPQTSESDLLEALNPNRVGSGEGGDWDTNETGSRIAFGPGEIALLKGFEKVGQLSHAEPKAFLEPIRDYAKMISATTDTPLFKFQGIGNSPPSGEALRITEAPLNKKVRDRCRMFGETLRQAFEFALAILGYADVRVVVTWANPATVDLTEVWQLVKLKVDLGVDPQTALMYAGVPERQAKAWAPEVARLRDRRAERRGQEPTSIERRGARSYDVETAEQE